MSTIGSPSPVGMGKVTMNEGVNGVQDEQSPSQNASAPRPLILAYVDDAHNLGCLVRIDGDLTPRRAHFSRAVQHAGVVIRAGHVVAVDLECDPPEVVWRFGMHTGVLRVEGDVVTVDLGYPNHRQVTLPLRDERPEAERATPLAAGADVLLRGKLAEGPRITDVFAGGTLAHPERLRAVLARLCEQSPDGVPGHSCRL